MIEPRLGEEAPKRLHIPLWGIEYGPRGERWHLPLQRSGIRDRDALRPLREAGASGRAIRESPAQEDDARHLQCVLRRMV